MLTSRASIRNLDTLVHVQDLINVSGGQVLAIAHQVFVGGRVRIISAARRIVHDASVVIWGVTRVRVVLASASVNL